MKKKMNKKAFTLIELIVVIAVVGILVLLGIPRFTGHKERAELARIQYDIKVMEQEIGTAFINNDDDFDNWENNSKDFNQLIQEGKLFEKEGPVKKVESADKTHKIIPEKYKDKINTKLKGTFYANSGGKVYYEHTKPLAGIPTEPEKDPEYSNEKIQDLIDDRYIPIATANELNNVRNNTEQTYGKGTEWEGLYTGGLDKKYIQVANIDLSVYSEEGWNPIGTESESFIGAYDGGNYVITNLEVKGEGKNYQGLFGYTNGATIRNVGLIDNKVTGASQVGGLVGYARNSTTISNSYAEGSVTGTGDYHVGGLVGMTENNSKISNSYTTGSVTGQYYVGGLVGGAYQNTTISNSYSTGSVEGSDDRVGGLVGSTTGISIENSYATGSVTGSGDYVGGLVGEAGYSGSSSTISNSYATGSVTGSGRSVGGLVGATFYSCTIENSYATGEVTGTGNTVGGLVGWASGNSNSGGINIRNSYTTGSVKGSDDSVGGLVGSAHFNTIENSYATGSVEGIERGTGGVVGAAYNSMISNSYATGEVTGKEVGGLVGQAYQSTISNSYTTGEVEGTGDYVGGLVGFASSSTIEKSYSIGSVTGPVQTEDSEYYYVGGLAGRALDNSTISNSYATGEVTGNNVGGLVGWANSSTTINNSYATGSVEGTGNYIGGLAGRANNNTEISNSYSIGLVKGLGENVGGLIGSTKYLDEYEFSSTISNSYWDVGTSGQSSSDGGTGMTTEQMMKQGTYSGWSFEEIWEIQEGVSYPTLINNPERH